MNLEELRKKLAELRAAMKGYVSRDDLTDDEAEKLAALNSQAVKLEGQITAAEQLAKADAENAERIEREKKEAVEAALKAERAANRRPAGGSAPYQAQFSELNRYDTMDRTDLAVYVDMLNAFKAKNVRYANGDEIRVDPSAVKALAMRVAETKPTDNTEEGRQEAEYIKYSFKAATHIDPTPDAVGQAIKAEGDPVYTGGSLAGADWVGTAYATELWRKIRADTQVVGKIPSEVIPDGYSSKTWPLESTDMTWYKVPEVSAGSDTLKIPAATVPHSKLATASKNITVGKVGAAGVYSGEMDEDSLVRFSAQLRTQLEVSGQEILESLVIDGDVDTSTNTNINAINTDVTATDYFLTFDGFRKLALITTPTNALSASGSLAVEDFLKTLKLMGSAGIAGSDPSKCAFIIDGNVYYALPQLSELKTRDTFNPATLENGFVTRLWNVPVIGSWQMHHQSAKRMANTAGKINTSDASNTTGSALAVRWDQWKLAYKRRMTMEVTRIANADAWEIVALCRVGLGYRDGEAAAILYNIGL